MHQWLVIPSSFWAFAMSESECTDAPRAHVATLHPAVSPTNSFFLLCFQKRFSFSQKFKNSDYWWESLIVVQLQFLLALLCLLRIELIKTRRSKQKPYTLQNP